MSVEKGRTAGSKAVEIRGLHQWMAAQWPDPVVLIINGDKENIWLCHLSLNAMRDEECEKDGK